MVLTKVRGRKRIVSPETTPEHGHYDSGAILKALARAHYWQRLLDSGAFANIQDLAAAERLNSSYVARVLRLVLLSPAIIDALLDGQLPAITIQKLTSRLPTSWPEQASVLGFC